MNASLWVEHLITFCKPTKKWWLRCSTHKGAFIINDFLRNPHFNILHNILSLTAYYEYDYESNVNDNFYIDEDAVAGAALFALGALALAAHRQRRATISIDETDVAFSVLAAQEPAQCYRRLICILATGSFEMSENDIIVSLFNKDTSIDSVKYEFANAAKLGKQWKSVQQCELRYSCPLSGEQIQHIIKIQANSLTNSQLT